MTGVHAGVCAAGCSMMPGKPTAYLINWLAGFISTNEPADHPATLIHELTHVWQGENGVALPVYMAQSMLAQGAAVARDYFRTWEWKGVETPKPPS